MLYVLGIEICRCASSIDSSFKFQVYLAFNVTKKYGMVKIVEIKIMGTIQSRSVIAIDWLCRRSYSDVSGAVDFQSCQFSY